MRTPKTIAWLICALLHTLVLDGRAESYYRLLFERGLFMMEAEADLQGALPIFQEIVKRHPYDRRYAALSQFYLGLCYKRMGSALAPRAFRAVITDFSDQTHVVRLAEAELQELSVPEDTESRRQPESMPRMIWAGRSVYGTGTLSGDGRYYAYIELETGGIDLLEIAARLTRPLVRSGGGGTGGGFAESAAISPDSRRIAFGWRNPGGGCELGIVNVDGSGRRTLFSDATVRHLRPEDWTADAERILVSMTGEDLTARIVFIDSRDGTLFPIRAMEGRLPGPVRLSPDGRYLAYSLFTPGKGPGRDIYLYDIREKEEVSLIDGPGDDCVLDWTPQGRHVLFLGAGEGGTRVFSLSFWEGRPRLPARDIGAGPGSYHAVGTAGDRALFYERRGGGVPGEGNGPGRTELWTVDGFFPEQSRVLTVPEPFATIQSAVSSAGAGDTVYVRSGEYRENITIDKPLSLVGEDRDSTIIDGGGGGSVIKITAGRVGVDGFTIRNGQIGVDLRPARAVRQVTLRNNLVTANSGDGILSRSSGGGHTIENCILSHNGAYALNAHQFSQSVIRQCQAFGNNSGLRVGWGWYIRVEDNQVYQNGSTGIYPDSCYFSTFERNLIHANGALGIKLGYISSRNTLRENIILGNEVGILVGLEWGGFSRNRIYHNDLLLNGIPVGETRPGLARFQEWDNGHLSEGNFWSGYGSQDRDGDGIGDAPHPIVPGARDRFPLVRPRNRIQAGIEVERASGAPADRNGWLLVRIELPAGLQAGDIAHATLCLNDTVPPDSRRSSVGDSDADGIPDLTVRFRWKRVLATLRPGESPLVSVSGELGNGLRFAGSASLESGEL